MPALPAFRSRNYRLFFAGQLISLIGTWMQQIAMSWLVYRLTDSTVMLGLVSFAGQLPILLFSTLAGVWNDRHDRRRLLLATQALAMVQAVALYAMTLGGTVTPVALVLLAALLGCINAIDLPVRQAYIAELLDDRADLANAIGLNAFLMHASRFLGPAIAGLIVATAGEATCFLLNALSYLGVLAALAAIRTPPRPPPPPQNAFAALRAGLHYAFRHPRIRLSLWLVAGFSFLVSPYATMMPVLAREFFAGDAATYGFLIGSAGCGSLGAAAFLALRGRHGKSPGLDRLATAAVVSGGMALACFAALAGSILAYPLLAILGFSVVLVVAGSNTLIQMVVDETYRGRVMAIFATAFLGVAPLGSLTVGAISAVIGVRPTLGLCGILAVILGVFFIRQPAAAE